MKTLFLENEKVKNI